MKITFQLTYTKFPIEKRILHFPEGLKYLDSDLKGMKIFRGKKKIGEFVQSWEEHGSLCVEMNITNRKILLALEEIKEENKK